MNPHNCRFVLIIFVYTAAILIGEATLTAASFTAEIAGQLTFSVSEQDAPAISFSFRPAPPQNFLCSYYGSVSQCVEPTTEYNPNGPIYSFTAGPVSGGFATGQGFAGATSAQPQEGIEIENSSLQPIVVGLLVTAVGQLDAQAGVMQFGRATVSELLQIGNCVDVDCAGFIPIAYDNFDSSIDTRVNPGSPTPLGLPASLTITVPGGTQNAGGITSGASFILTGAGASGSAGVVVPEPSASGLAVIGLGLLILRRLPRKREGEKIGWSKIGWSKNAACERDVQDCEVAPSDSSPRRPPRARASGGVSA